MRRLIFDGLPVIEAAREQAATGSGSPPGQRATGSGSAERGRDLRVGDPAARALAGRELSGLLGRTLNEPPT